MTLLRIETRALCCLVLVREWKFADGYAQTVTLVMLMMMTRSIRLEFGTMYN
jgi:hypothetical protein